MRGTTGSPSEENSTCSGDVPQRKRVLDDLELGRRRHVAKPEASELVGRRSVPGMDRDATANRGHDDFATAQPSRR